MLASSPKLLRFKRRGRTCPPATTFTPYQNALFLWRASPKSRSKAARSPPENPRLGITTIY